MCWLTDVIIPIICALVGGGLTMWGVQRTLKAQRIESDHIRIQEAKPYLFMEHPMQAPAWDSIPRVTLESAEGDSGNYELQCYVKSSDNGIAVVKKVTTDNHTYIPIWGNIVDKNCVTGLSIHRGRQSAVDGSAQPSDGRQEADQDGADLKSADFCGKHFP